MFLLFGNMIFDAEAGLCRCPEKANQHRGVFCNHSTQGAKAEDQEFKLNCKIQDSLGYMRPCRRSPPPKKKVNNKKQKGKRRKEKGKGRKEKKGFESRKWKGEERCYKTMKYMNVTVSQ